MLPVPEAGRCADLPNGKSGEIIHQRPEVEATVAHTMVRAESLNRLRALASVVVASLLAAGCAVGPASTGQTTQTVAQATATPFGASASVGPAIGTNSPASSGPPSLRAGATPSAVPAGLDSGVVLELVAQNVRWDKTQLVAPKDARFKVHLVHRDPPNEHHNLAIGVGSSPKTATRLFVGIGFGRGERTYEIPPLAAGTYLFWCSTHPEVMVGTLTVR